MKRLNSILLFTITFILFYCCKSLKGELQTSDVNGHGSNLTPAGCLVYKPWEYNLGSNNWYNIQLLLNDSLLSSKAAVYTKEEANLVFELQKDFTLKYWTKSDYIKSPTDTMKNGVVIKRSVPTDNTNLKNIYKGKWSVNFKDSTLNINFRDKRKSLPKLVGKYIHLGSTSMTFQQTVFIDSTMNNKRLKLKKVITTYLTH